MVSFGERKSERIVDVCFLGIPCENVYNYILGKSFPVALDAVDTTFHLKMKYHNIFGESVVTPVDLHEVHLIHKKYLEILEQPPSLPRRKLRRLMRSPST